MDQLSKELISEALTSRRFDRPLDCFPVVDSTNETAREPGEREAGNGNQPTEKQL